MPERHKADLEAKKAKLEEMRRLREERRKADQRRQETRIQQTTSSSHARREADELLKELAGLKDTSLSTGEQTPLSSIPGTPPSRFYNLGSFEVSSGIASGRLSRASAAASDEINLGSTLREELKPERPAPEFVEFDQEIFEIPQKERVIYSKEVQTIVVWDEEELQDTQVGHDTKPPLQEEEMSQEDIERESIQLDKEIIDEIRDMNEEERAAILANPELTEFVDFHSKVIERMISDNYDYIRDYKAGADSGLDDSEGKRVKPVCTFWQEKLCKNRSITGVDWSPKFPELSVAAYNKNNSAINEPAGVVAIWNLHLVDRPEFVFYSQSDVLSVVFSPFHSNLVFGGTYAGQILLWDTRAKQLPVLKTPLSAAGHTHPVYAMQMVGTQNAHNLVTSSSDGLICSWLVDMLAQPQETLELTHTGHGKTNEVAVTCLDFPDNETTTFWVGTEEGNLYQAKRYDRAGSKAGINPHDVYRGHAGPVTGLHFHPLSGPIDFSDLFLSCSVDWTVKLWRAKSAAKPSTSSQMITSIYSFDESDDYVYDVRWHPLHPAIFGSVNGSGRFDLWNLNADTEVPIVSTTIGTGRALNKFRWDRKEGRRVALGSSDGRMYIYDIGDTAVSRESEWTDLQRTIGNLNATGTVGVMDGLNEQFTRSVYR